MVVVVARILGRHALDLAFREQPRNIADDGRGHIRIYDDAALGEAHEGRTAHAGGQDAVDT